MTERSHPFPGFPARSRATVLPSVFFSDVLPEIEEWAELLVTLYAFYAVGRKRASERWLTIAQLTDAAPLCRALQRLDGGARIALGRGLALAVERGTLVGAEVAGEMRFAVNTPTGRRGLALGKSDAAAVMTGGGTEPLPNIYMLYEEAIGTISPLIADELRAAEEEYADEWIEAAFREAAAQNRRSWRYVARILERWRDEGRHNAAVGRDSGARRDLAGRYHGLIRR